MTNEKQDKKEENFPLEKILSISALEYIKSQYGKELYQYSFVGVHFYGSTGNINEFAREKYLKKQK